MTGAPSDYKTHETMTRKLLLILTLLVVPAVPAAAQAVTAACERPAPWKSNLAEQLTVLLGYEERHGDVLDLTLRLHREGCFAPEAAEMGALVARILDVYEQSGDDSHRILAAILLDRLGDDESIARLGQLAQAEANPTVKHVARAIVRAHAAE